MKKEKAFTVRVTTEMHQQLKKQAVEENRTIVGLIRHAVTTYLKKTTNK